LVGVLEGHCERLGRDISEITKTRLGTLLIAPTHEGAERKLDALRRRPGVSERMLATVVAGDPDTVAERATELLDAGLDALIFSMPDNHDVETVALLGQTLGPLMAERGAATA
jgi:alkanesulfonate monooxygenase SsuD/methylene tetrahydromethanopterin reductase-like flavin-dependent oxidoreductase (luciferase family)